MMKQRQKVRQSASDQKKWSKDSDSDDEEVELLSRQRTPRREIATVEKVVEDGDTLQSLAIRYHCTIEDLKRLNNIHKENEIFAKRTIKVPHRPFTAALAGVHASGTTSPIETLPSTSKDSPHHLDITRSLIKLKLPEESEVNQIIFNSNIAQKSSPESTQFYNNITNENLDLDDNDDEEIHLIPNERLIVEPPPPIVTKLDCSGVDGDISLKALIACIVILIFAVPLIYVFYIAEHPEQYHHNNHHNS